MTWLKRGLDRIERGGTTLPRPAVFAIAALGIAIFSAMDAVMKGLTLALGAYTPLLWRSVASAVISFALYAAARPQRPSARAVRLHLQRGAISTLMTLCFFWGLARVPMAQAIALTFIAPLLSLFLSALLLGERLRPATIGASCLALGGVVVILAGQFHGALGRDAWHGSLAILFSALCYALNIVLMRQQAMVAGPVEVAFSQSVVVAVLLALAAPFVHSVPIAAHATAILAASFLAVISLLLLAFAYARAEANYLSSGEYTAFAWASLLGWLVFGEHLSAVTIAGAALIVSGCAIAARQRAAPGFEMDAAV